MVAPSFQALQLLSEPFLKNGKYYVTVKTNKGGERVVRWYDEKEYNKAFGTKIVAKASKKWDMRQARGFSEGPVYVLRNLSKTAVAYCESHPHIRFAVDVGWHIPSEHPIPQDLPADLKLVPLSYEDFKGADDETPKPAALLAAIINKKEKMICAG
jgi:hypothetical protein